MGVEALDSSFDEVSEIDSDTIQPVTNKFADIDARRRLEDKMEELRLKREIQEFDFDHWA